MAKKKRDAADAAEVEREEPVAYEPRDETVHVDRLVRSPLNPRTIRTAKDEAKVAELADSIRRVGVLDRLIVRETFDGFFEILAGDSRWRAVQRAMEDRPELAQVPVRVFDVPDAVALEIAIASNDQRADPHPLDQCSAFMTLRDTYGYSVPQIAAKVGRSAQHVYDRLRFEQLAPVGRDALIADRISITVALILARIASVSVQERVTDELLRRYPDGPPVHAAQDAAKARLMVLADAPFDVTSATLTRAGACTSCPKRSEAQQHLFGDLLGDYEEARENRCTDPECWDAKRDAAWELTAEAARAEGKRVADEAEAKKIFPHEYGGPAAGYVELGARDWSVGGDGTRTIRETLAERAGELEVTVVRGPDGAPREVAKAQDVRELLAGGEKGAAAASSDSKSDVDYALEREIDSETRRRLRDAIASAIVAGGWRIADFWRAFARLVIRCWADVDPELDAEVRQRFGIPAPSDDDLEDVEETLVRASADMEPESRHLALIVDLVLDMTPGGVHSSASADEPFPSFLAALNIDRKHHAREAAKAIKASRKAKEAKKSSSVAKSATKKKSRAELDAEEAEARREQMEDAYAGE